MRPARDNKRAFIRKIKSLQFFLNPKIFSPPLRLLHDYIYCQETKIKTFTDQSSNNPEFQFRKFKQKNFAKNPRSKLPKIQTTTQNPNPYILGVV